MKDSIRSLLEVLPENTNDYDALFVGIEQFTNSRTIDSLQAVINLFSLKGTMRSLNSIGWLFGWGLKQYMDSSNLDIKQLITDLISNGLLEEVQKNPFYSTKIANLLSAFKGFVHKVKVEKESLDALPRSEQIDEIYQGVIEQKANSMGVLSKAILENQDWIDFILNLESRKPKDFANLMRILNTQPELSEFFFSLTNLVFIKETENLELVRAQMLENLVQLVTKPQVVSALSSVLSSELMRDLFNGDKLSPQVKAYGDLLINLATSKPQQFQDLFNSLAQTKEFKPFLSSLMNFIYKNEQDVDFIHVRAAMLENLVQLVTKPQVVSALSVAVSPQLVKDLFNGDKFSPQVKAYDKLILHLSEQPDKFQNFFYTLTNTDQFRVYLSDLMRFIYPIPQLGESLKEATNKTFDQSMLSLIDAITNTVIVAAIPLLGPELIQDILELSKREIVQLKDTVEIAPNRGIAKKISRRLSQQEIQDKRQEIDHESERILEQAIQPRQNISPFMKKIIKRLKSMAENKEELQSIKQFVKEYELNLSGAIEMLRESEGGKILKTLHIDGSEIVQGILPNILNERGLKAMTRYLESQNSQSMISLAHNIKIITFVFEHIFHIIKKLFERVSSMCTPRDHGNALETKAGGGSPQDPSFVSRLLSNLGGYKPVGKSNVL